MVDEPDQASTRSSHSTTKDVDGYVVFDLETIADQADRRDHEIIEIAAGSAYSPRRDRERTPAVYPDLRTKRQGQPIPIRRQASTESQAVGIPKQGSHPRKCIPKQGHCP